ncbi:unnamed protein product [Kuraishia capsulata CBS 1993]|uniref:Purine nucleoside phosphorylase n=1 Tax=Kuraishia capsulata CBS 1993 TaxID=1382522 RepID=W6MIX3_9ASCO|nr:uncharacterized protein KUCA_T00002421001 [Kuraishia capsulata CBS 1993]CDK26449.1 unnamed protein product [Kuraishia capsulata CBS 1993]
MKTEARIYEEIDAAVAYIQLQTSTKPKVLIVCGSGLGGISKVIDKELTIPFKDIPNWVQSTVEGHEGNLVFGKLNGVDVVAMVGRLHFYEGYSFEETTLPIRVCSDLGVESMIVTNAAGGINQTYNVGDLMVIKDHINFPGLCGFNPLRGVNLSRYGPRFPATSDAYDVKIRDLIRQSNGVEELVEQSSPLRLAGRKVHEGVYTFVSGPSYETNSEVSLISRLGGDCVGMSTVPEVLVARHCGLKVFGLSLITNSCNPQDVTSHTEVLMHASIASADVEKLVTALVKFL